MTVNLNVDESQYKYSSGSGSVDANIGARIEVYR
jgi:hypothetical protein